MAEASTPTGELVQLYIYDLSNGMARTFSQMLLGRQIDAIFHTSIAIGGWEHYFGGGIQVARAHSTPFGRPMEVLDLGHTELPEDLRAELLADLSERYTPESYSLFHNNCNSFSNELAQLLCGRSIPPHITGLPAEVLATPFGQMIAPMLSGLEQQLRGMQGQAMRPPAAGAEPAAGEAGALSSRPGQPLLPAAAAAAAAAGAPPAGSPAEERSVAGIGASAVEGPAVQAAEHEIEAAVAAGMMQEAGQKQHSQVPQPAQQADGAATGAAAKAGLAGGFGGEEAAKLALEEAVQAEYRRIMAAGGVSEHEAQAAALEAVAVQQSLDWHQQHQQQEQQREES
ncbi:Desumoylating isopeptidase 1 [Chlorella vulgaris]